MTLKGMSRPPKILLALATAVAALVYAAAGAEPPASALDPPLPAAPLAAEPGSGARADSPADHPAEASPAPSPLEIVVPIDRPVPWRMFTLADPPRLVIDLRGAGPTALPAVLPGAALTGARSGPWRDGWTRIVLDLAQPLLPRRAELVRTGGEGARIELVLVPADEAAFRAAAGDPQAPSPVVPPAAPEPDPLGRITVVLDPGHGGIDPGAEAGDQTEAALMLTFAQELAAAFEAAGGYRVVLTREADVFVPLDMRITVARASGADLFLSLHADSVSQGRATGATIYTLSETASDAAAAALAERHDRADLLAGVDLRHKDDVIAGVLMDLARQDTRPRSEALADAIAHRFVEGVGGLHKRPRLAAGFSVLRAPDIPSVLIELGFISSSADRDRLTSPEWRARAAAGIVAAVGDWREADAARAGLLRR
jgi:N-acetylmuramoyl-L-alanine amidase